MKLEIYNVTGEYVDTVNNWNSVWDRVIEHTGIHENLLSHYAPDYEDDRWIVFDTKEYGNVAVIVEID